MKTASEKLLLAKVEIFLNAEDYDSGDFAMNLP
jgi:hypothetical protein